jgi:hypothetical protein
MTAADLVEETNFRDIESGTALRDGFVAVRNVR